MRVLWADVPLGKWIGRTSLQIFRDLSMDGLAKGGAWLSAGGVSELQLYPAGVWGLWDRKLYHQSTWEQSVAFPSHQSLLDLLCACSARRNASTARIALSGLCC